MSARLPPDRAAIGRPPDRRRSGGTTGTFLIHVDFETRTEVPVTGPWDLRFQRFHISAYGGVTGTGGVEVMPIAGRALAEVTAPPAAGWLTDAPDGDDGNLDPDYAFEQGDGWYSYDPQKHVLRPRPLVWVVKSNGGGAIKLELERYYDPAGTPGWIAQLDGAPGAALFLDEPTAALDPHHGAVVLALARRAARAGHPVVVVLHDLTLAARWADRVIILSGGRTLAAGAPEAVLTPALLAAAYDTRFEVLRGGGGLVIAQVAHDPHRAGAAAGA